MKPVNNEKEPYLFKVMNLHTGAGTSLEEMLWKRLPYLSVSRQLEFEWLSGLLSLFIDRIILMEKKSKHTCFSGLMIIHVRFFSANIIQAKNFRSWRIHLNIWFSVTVFR